jgi:hypothetical protein
MKLFTLLSSCVLITLTSAQGQPCAAGVVLPCSCPEGTDYIEAGTYIIAGVPSAQAFDLTFNFFNTTWQKRPIISTEGTDNTVGATRTIKVNTKVGYYNIKQKVSTLVMNRCATHLLTYRTQLTYHAIAPDGSFKALYEQVGEVPFTNGQGKFAGWWETFQGENAFPYQTPMRWSLHACQTGGNPGPISKCSDLNYLYQRTDGFPRFCFLR